MIRHFRATLVVLVISLIASAGVVHAGALTSSWFKGFHSRARLTAATLLGKENGYVLYAGIDIRLDKNWKTYWRSPGDGGGVPPEFDWAGSKNVRAVHVMYPLPKLLKDKYGNSIGYKDKVIFPVTVTPENPSQPVRLRLKLYYGVCEDICIPAEASLKLDVAPQARAAIPVQRDLIAAISRVPALAVDGLSVTATKAVLTGASPHLLVTAKARNTSAKINLFIASRESGYLPLARRIEQTTDGHTVFRIDLKHLDKASSLSGKTLDLIIAANGRGLSVPWSLPSGS
jgi:DsbC/DsbD-like thiol-disulfide interchange protein